MRKTSVIVPILNEEKSIEKLLIGLQKQTVQPNEVVLIDGGSTDDTLSLIKVFAKKYDIEIKVISTKKSNRSQARNIGAREAEYDILVFTDAGCVPKEDWLQKITEPFQKNDKTEVVAGFYDPQPENTWQDIIANVTSTRTWNFNPATFLPSSRSLAISRDIWKKVGGYPEELDTCEDLVYAEKLKRQATVWIVVQDAQVIWKQESTLDAVRDKIFNYALGDLQAGYERHVSKIYSAVWRMIALLGLAVPLIFATELWMKSIGLAFFALYILGTWVKHRRSLRNPLALIYSVIIQLNVDMALIQALLFFKMNRK